MKKRMAVVALIGLLMAAVLVLIGCTEPGDNCPADGDCITKITLEGSTYKYDSDTYKNCGNTTEGSDTGCIVADMHRWNSTNIRTGTHKCNCM